jgi:multidrug resistance efflux pump
MALITASDLGNTAIIFRHQTRLRSQIIYSVTLIAIILALVSMHFLYTTVSVKGSGLIQSGIEKTELFASASGRLTSVNLADNQKVVKGKILFTIDATLPDQQKALLNNHNNQIELQLNDANVLLTFPVKPVLRTGLYTASWQQYKQQLQNAVNIKEQALHIYERYQILHNKKVVTEAEYEQYQFNYTQAISEWEMITTKYKAQWQNEVNQYRNELRDLQNQKVQLNDLEKQYIVRAAINGSIQNLTGVQAGSYVYSNQKLGEISPDSALTANCYIKPVDIGLIKKGQQVRFQIDAFNYNQWGWITGRVSDISDDIIMQNQAPYFRVKCRLDKTFLQLKNGYKGQIKKGMTFSARFTVTKRSLYQLLYDKADNWLNPEVSN